MAENEFLKPSKRSGSVLTAARKEYNAAVRRARKNPHNKEAAADVLRYRKRLNRASAQVGG